MSEERNWKRIRERLALHLPVRVQGRDSSDFAWTEMTRLADVTPFGAGFTLKRLTEKGRLLHMTIPMPRQLRVFDYIEDQYRIWAVVRYTKAKPSDTGMMFHVGVAFIGKRPPKSYETEPWKRYDIAANAYQALAAPEDILKPLPTVDQRTYTRHKIAVDMRIEVVDPSGEIVKSEQTVTEDISTRGASIFTTLEIPIGRFIRLTSEQQGVMAHAAIRSRSIGMDGVPRIHVEFIDREWPL
jgi:hypothetical protein